MEVTDMRQRFAFAALAVGALALSTAWATTDFNGNTAPSGAHYSNGAFEPTCNVSGLSIECTGTSIAGVGNTDATLLLSASYSATVQCRNKGGKIVDVKTQVTGSSSSDDLTDVKNGTLTVSPFTLSGPSTASFLGAAVCPNGNWDKVLLGSPTLLSFTYTLTFDGFGQPAITITGP